MCWLTVGKSNEIPLNHIQTAYRVKNSHGFGISWYDNGVQTLKTMSYKLFRKQMKAIGDKQCIIHLRYATVGSVNIDNCHPFDVNGKQLYHNGTFFSLKPTATTCDTSDSAILASMLSMCNFNKLSDIQPLVQHIATDKINRIVMMELDGSISYINKNLGIESNGIWYSNDYHLQEPPKPVELLTKVFVYGTLKKGLSNHRLLKDAQFEGRATTLQQFKMVGKDDYFPYVLGTAHDLPGQETHSIQGEIYAVTPAELESLDTLEGYPTHYTKRKVAAIESDGTAHMVTMYIKATVNEYDLAKQSIANWRPSTPSYTDSIEVYCSDFMEAVDDLSFYNNDIIAEFSLARLQALYVEYYTAYYGIYSESVNTCTTKEDYITAVIQLSEDILADYDVALAMMSK